MDKLPLLFQFETTAIPTDTWLIPPLITARQRWVKEGLLTADGKERIFNVLYRLEDERYVGLTYGPARRRLIWSGWWKLERVWYDAEGPVGREISPDVAVQALETWNLDVPTEVRKAATHYQKHLIVPQGIGLPAGNPHRESLYSPTTAHAVDLRKELDQLVFNCVRAVQCFREWQQAPRPSPGENLRWLRQALFARYRVDISHWWGPKTDVPPTEVGLLGLDWPPQEKAVRQTIDSLQSLLREPIETARNVCAQASNRSSTIPSCLAEVLTEFECLTIRLRCEVEAYGTAPEPQPPDDVSPQGKCPHDNAFRVYTLFVTTGKSQTEVAKIFAKESGVPIEQGTVSRWIRLVKDWLQAGNKMPVLPPLPDRPSKTMDPSKLDNGQRCDGRTPRQRRNRSDNA